MSDKDKQDDKPPQKPDTSKPSMDDSTEVRYKGGDKKK